jgi:hypothetical protein
MIASAKSENGPAPGTFKDRAQSPTSPGQAMPGDPHPLEPLLKQVAMMREFALHYVEVQKDAAKSAVRRLVFKAILGLMAGIIGGTILIASVVMLADGLAELVSVAAGARPWVGKLVVGGVVILTVGLATWIFISRLLRAEREKIIRKYESLHHAQRAKFGSDVTQRAAL